MTSLGCVYVSIPSLIPSNYKLDKFRKKKSNSRIKRSINRPFSMRKLATTDKGMSTIDFTEKVASGGSTPWESIRRRGLSMRTAYGCLIMLGKH